MRTVPASTPLWNTYLPQVSYQSASPDEAALVEFARAAGVVFTSRSTSRLRYTLHGEPHELQLLAVNPFTSDRKRMSILVRDAAGGPCTLLCKGADDVLMPLLASGQTHAPFAISKLAQFAARGLRTLVLAKADVGHEAAKRWLVRYDKVLRSSAPSSDARATALAEVAAEVEAGLTLVGVSGIEDELQPRVPQTVRRLHRAHVRLWMLTGDKHETAVAIARAAGLVHDSTSVITLHGASLKATRKLLAARFADVQQWRQRHGLPATASLEHFSWQRPRRELAVVIDGAALYHIAEHAELRALFLGIALGCRTVVACRVSPRQKAEVVRMVQGSASPSPMTLAIGDGANDVSMLREAHVGVAVYGSEGLQAVQASDYSISQVSRPRRAIPHLSLTRAIPTSP